MSPYIVIKSDPRPLYLAHLRYIRVTMATTIMQCGEACGPRRVDYTNFE
jgi:hypothetical protein